jgi:hypothetical protein
VFATSLVNVAKLCDHTHAVGAVGLCSITPIFGRSPVKLLLNERTDEEI